MEQLRDRSFKHFDLPVNHLGRHGHYIPPKARDEAEIERRRTLTPGTLLAEQQQKGTAVAAKIIEFLIEKDDSDFAPKLIAAAGLNTAWHNHAQTATDVMRRRLWLPVHERAREPINKDSLLLSSKEGFDESHIIAGYIVHCINKRNSAIWSFKKRYGRLLGNTSLVLACVPSADLIAETPDPVTQQAITRRAALEVLDSSRQLEEHVGANPTFAQLADKDSPLSVYIRRNGTNLSVEALEFADAEVLDDV